MVVEGLADRETVESCLRATGMELEGEGGPTVVNAIMARVEARAAVEEALRHGRGREAAAARGLAVLAGAWR